VQQTELFESAVFDGANLTMIAGRYLVEGLQCEYAASAVAIVEYRDLVLNDSIGTKAHCDVPTVFFQEANLTGLDVELRIRGSHINESMIMLKFYPKIRIYYDNWMLNISDTIYT
jgi:hypothetical protein